MSIIIKKSSDSKVVTAINTKTHEVLTAFITMAPAKHVNTLVDMTVATSIEGMSCLTMRHKFRGPVSISVVQDLINDDPIVPNLIDIKFIAKGGDFVSTFSFRDDTVVRYQPNNGDMKYITYRDMIDMFINGSADTVTVSGGYGSTLVKEITPSDGSILQTSNISKSK